MAKRAGYDLIESAMIHCRVREDRAAADILRNILVTMPGYKRRIAAMGPFNESLQLRDALIQQFRSIVAEGCKLADPDFRVVGARCASTGSLYCTVHTRAGRSLTFRHADHSQSHAPEDVIDVPMSAAAVAAELKKLSENQ